MRPDRTPRLIPLALVLLVLVSAGCSAAAPSSDVGSTALPSTSASADALGSGVPTSDASASASASIAASATAASSSAPTQAPTPKPTAKPTATPTTSLGYQCAGLLHNSEVRKATGLADATLVNNQNGTPQAAGQTYCPYVAQSVQATVAASVWTGASYASFLNLWNSVATYSQPVSGIGTRAIIDAGDGTGLAIVGNLGVSIEIKGPSGVPAGVDAQTACQALLKLLASRV